MSRMDSGATRKVMRYIAVSLVASLAIVAQVAHAFFDPPWITPPAPRAGEMVFVNIHGGICDAIFESPGYPQITQEGSAIRIIEYGAHVTFDDWCIYGIGTLSEPVGAFPPGDYTLQVDLLYDDLAFGYTIMNLGVIPFTVTGATPVVPVPASNRWWLSVLSLLVVSSAVLILWIRQRPWRCEPCSE